jgi:hypothetical protein
MAGFTWARMAAYFIETTATATGSHTAQVSLFQRNATGSNPSTKPEKSETALGVLASGKLICMNPLRCLCNRWQALWRPIVPATRFILTTIPCSTTMALPGNGRSTRPQPGRARPISATRRAVFGDAGTYTATLTVNGQFSKSLQISIGDGCRADTIPGSAVNIGGNNTEDYVATPALNLTTNT